jgi:cytochrome c oxidase assembly protein subunit 15
MTNLFRRFGLLTVITVIGLIFVGGFVRASGSGMGCPDWPKCFGMWIPPTSIDQLPVNYAEIYGEKLKGEIVFNPTKTWIEYINRLFGVLTGIFIIISVFFSYKAYVKTKPLIFYLSFLALILVLLEGWLGAKVVSSELHPTMITVHMLLSLLVLGLLLFAVLYSYRAEGYLKDLKGNRGLTFLIGIGIVLTVGQIIFGTQIREGIDIAQKSLGEVGRGQWIDSVIGKVWFHSGLGFSILLVQILLFLRINKSSNRFSRKITISTLLSVLLIIFSGMVLTFAGFPALMQPFHLTLSVVIISLQFVSLFLFNVKNN